MQLSTPFEMYRRVFFSPSVRGGIIMKGREMILVAGMMLGMTFSIQAADAMIKQPDIGSPENKCEQQAVSPPNVMGTEKKAAAASQPVISKETDKKSDKKTASMLSLEQVAAIQIPKPVVLSKMDFQIGTIRRGNMLNKVKRIFGSPTKYLQSTHYTTIQYDDSTLKLRVVSRNDTVPFLKQTGEERKAVRVGIDAVYLGRGEKVSLGRELHLKLPTEVLVRQFGIPTNVLRDADANVYYMVYQHPTEDTDMVFAIANRKIERVALMQARPPYSNGNKQMVQNKRTERDFTLMGFGLDAPFQANKYNMWNNLIKRDTNNFWLYGDYGVEVDRHNMVRKVFLLTNNAYTSRGATLGYHVSTILKLYGRPDRVELGPGGEKSVDAYYYDSSFQKGVSLVFVIKHETQYVEDVILTDSPIKNLQDPMTRYGLK